MEDQREDSWDVIRSVEEFLRMWPGMAADPTWRDKTIEHLRRLFSVSRMLWDRDLVNIEALAVLKGYREWEANCLNSDEKIFIDGMNDDLYEEMLDLQRRREEILNSISPDEDREERR